MHPSAAPQDDLRVPRRPRDAQRTRLYLAETPMPSSPLPGLDACARFVDRVVGSMWWHLRFPDRNLAIVPRLRPGNGARQAFYREEETGPTITLPRRCDCRDSRRWSSLWPIQVPLRIACKTTLRRL